MFFNKDNLKNTQAHNQTALKKLAAQEALKFIKPEMVLGVGTGSTVNCLIELLGEEKNKNIKNFIKTCVSSSNQTSELLKKQGLPTDDLNNQSLIDLYIDGADEINFLKQMIKGGGGALTKEKIVAACSKKFICIADESKLVKVLGKYPLPIEVIPMARSYVARELVKLGGQPIYRENFISDSGNIILDVFNLNISEPIKLEQDINNITGVVTNGLFAQKGADVGIIAGAEGIRII